MNMTMRKKVFFMCLSLGCAGLLASCSAENDAEGTEQASNQKGKVTFDLASSVEFTTGTRAVDESSYQNFDNYTVNILDNKGASKFSGTFATLQSRLPLELDLGSYSVTASYGTEYDASRDGFKVEGSNTFTISAANTVTTTVNCTPTAGKVLVAFDASMSNYYDTYSVAFSGTEALGAKVATWGKDDTQPYYLALNEDGERVTYTIYLTAKSEFATMQNGNKLTEATATGSFILQRNAAKQLTIRPNYTPTTDGGLAVTVTIDDSTNDKPIDIEVPVSWIGN